MNNQRVVCPQFEEPSIQEFERLFQASPMSKILQVNFSQYGKSKAPLAVTTSSKAALLKYTDSDAKMTPKAQIFHQLKAQSLSKHIAPLRQTFSREESATDRGSDISQELNLDALVEDANVSSASGDKPTQVTHESGVVHQGIRTDSQPNSISRVLQQLKYGKPSAPDLPGSPSVLTAPLDCLTSPATINTREQHNTQNGNDRPQINNPQTTTKSGIFVRNSSVKTLSAPSCCILNSPALALKNSEAATSTMGGIIGSNPETPDSSETEITRKVKKRRERLVRVDGSDKKGDSSPVVKPGHATRKNTPLIARLPEDNTQSAEAANFSDILPNNRDKKNSEVSAISKKLSNKAAKTTKISQAKTKETVLTHWFLVPNRKWKNICVEGHRKGDESDQMWHSSTIDKRLSSRVLRTVNGSTYKLCGSVVVEDCEDMGFSPELIREFNSGFPENWQMLLDKHFQEQRDLEGPIDSPEAKTRKLGQPRGRPRKNFVQPSTPWTRRLRSSERETNKRSARKHAQNTAQSDETQELDLTTLPTTRSGRKVIPQLAWWTNQRVVVLHKTQVTQIFPGTPNHLDGGSPQVSFKHDERALRRELRLSKKNLKNHQAGYSSSDANTTDSHIKSAPCSMKPTAYRTHPCTVNITPLSRKQQKHVNSSDDSPQLTPSKSPRSYRGKKGKQISKATDAEVRYAVCLQNNMERLTTNEPQSQRDDPQPEGTDENMDPLPNSDLLTLEKLSQHSHDKIPHSLSRSERTTGESRPVLHSKQKSEPCRLQNSHKNCEKIVSESETSDSDHGKNVRHCINRPPKNKRRATLVKLQSGSPHVVVHNILNKPQEQRDSEIVPQNPIARRTRASLNSRHKVSNEIVVVDGSSSADDARCELSKPCSRTRSTTCQRKVLSDVDPENKPRNKTRKPNPRTHSESRVKPLDILLTSPEVERAASRSSGRHKASTRHSFPQEKKSTKQFSLQAPRGGRGRKRRGSSMESDSDFLPHNPAKKNKGGIQKNAKPKVKHTDEKQPRTLCPSDDTANSTESWTDQEMNNLKRALTEVGPDTAMFWEVIASRVKSRSAEECIAFHFKDVPNTIRKRNRTKSDRPKVTAANQITGKVGTMKRKQQLREFMEHFDDGYEDDLFDSTPFRKIKTVKVAGLSENDEELLSNKSRFLTPASCQGKVFRRYSWMPTPGDKTPGLSLHSPGFSTPLDRKEMDQYVNKLMKRRKRVSCEPKRNLYPTLLKEQDVANDQPPAPDADASLFEVNQVSDNESEEDRDYYFSDAD